MENNFYVGVVHHDKGIISEGYNEKMVLYTEDNYCFVDLIEEKTYNTDSEEKEYVLENTLIPIDVNDFDIDYVYLLNKYKDYGRNLKKKNKINFFNKTK